MAFQGNVANVTELVRMASVALAASLLVPGLAPALLTELARYAREPPTVTELVRMATVTVPRAQPRGLLEQQRYRRRQLVGLLLAPAFLDVGRQDNRVH